MPNEKPGSQRAIQLGSWAPGDYINEHRFCPLDDIQLALDQYRAQAGASELAVLALDANVCLRTLSFVAHNDTVGGRALNAALTERPFRLRDILGNNPLWRNLDDDDLSRVLTKLADPRLYERSDGGTFFDLLKELHENEPWRVVGGQFLVRQQVAINCLVLHRGGTPRRGEEFVRTITVGVNGTANASTHRDRKVAAQVEKALDQVSEQAIGEAQDLFLPLVQMARRVTQSAAAAAYIFVETEPSHARLVATSIDAPRGYALRSQTLPEDGRNAPTLATASFSQRRPLLLLERPTEPGLCSTWLFRGGDVRHELAVPIPAAPGGGSTPNAGVIVLCRGPRSDSPSYGNYELALVRNVALRIALLRTSLMMDEAGLAIATAAEAFAVADAGPGSGKDYSVRYGPRLHAVADQTESTLPEDLRRALPHLTPIIEFAGRLTGAHSATLRLLLRGGTNRHNRTQPILLRAVAWPSGRLEDEHSELRLSDDCVNSWVARTGNICYLNDVTNPAGLRGYRGLDRAVRVSGRGTRAELCVPVFVDERLTATVNLESATPNAFALLGNVGRGCAAMVALAIAAIRRRHLRDVLSIGSDVQSSAHDLTGLADELRRSVGLAADAQTTAEAAIQSALKTLEEVIPVLAPADAERNEPEADDLRVILNRAATDAGITAFRNLADRPDVDTTVTWSVRSTRRFYLAMLEVFRNVDRHGSIDRYGFPELYFNHSQIGGRRQIEIEIIHGLRPMLSTPVASLYRVPIVSSRLHFGAYTAGAIVRSLGGDILAQHLKGNRLRTHVSVPVDADRRNHDYD